jgi:hypothetical protein
MPASVATASVATAPVPAPAVPARETSHVPAAAEAARMATAKRLVMPSAIVMVLPIVVVPESRRVTSAIERQSIRVGGVAIAWIAIGAISRFAASAYPAAE